MHRMDYRKPDIEESFCWLVKHLDGRRLHSLLRGNAKKIIQERKYRNENTETKIQKRNTIKKQENRTRYGKDV